MGSYVVRIKVLPTGPEVPPQQLLDSIKGKLDKDMVLRSSKEDPIAFGLYSLTVDIVTPEEEGRIDKVEQRIHNMEQKFDMKFDLLTGKVIELDNRIIRLEERLKH